MQLRKNNLHYFHHRDSSFEYPQHMFWLRNKKNNNGIPQFLKKLILKKVDGQQSCENLASLQRLNIHIRPPDKRVYDIVAASKESYRMTIYM